MRNVYAKNQLFMVINAISETILNGTIQSKKNAFRKEWETDFIKDFSENFSFTVMAERYFKVYQKIIQG